MKFKIKGQTDTSAPQDLIHSIYSKKTKVFLLIFKHLVSGVSSIKAYFYIFYTNKLKSLFNTIVRIQFYRQFIVFN